MKIEIDESIILPDTCDNMPDNLRQHLLGALTDASERLKCHYKDLHWNVRIDKKSRLPYISIKRRKAS